MNRTIGAVVAILVILLIGASFLLLRPRAIYVAQPIDFNHKKHHEELGMECVFCHSYVEEYAVAGLPTRDVCATCHEEGMETGNPRFEQVVEKLKTYNENDQQIMWVRMYELPDHLIFSHARHVGGDIPCKRCHGITGESEVPMKQDYPLVIPVNLEHKPPYIIKMNACMDCHEERNVSNDCLTCHM